MANKIYIKITAVSVVLILTIIGVYTLIFSHAESPYAIGVAAEGTLTGEASIINDSNASGDEVVSFGGQPLLGALAPTSSDTTLYSSGFREIE
jgi:hypothetical protein